MNSADMVILLIIAALVAGVIKVMRIQKKKGSPKTIQIPPSLG